METKAEDRIEALESVVAELARLLVLKGIIRGQEMRETLEIAAEAEEEIGNKAAALAIRIIAREILDT